MRDKLLLLLTILLIFCAAVLAQKGSIKGVVTDSKTGEAIIGATVRVVGTNFGNQTDADGQYRIQNLEPGVYEFQVAYIGYKTMVFKNIKILSDEITIHNFQIEMEYLTSCDGIVDYWGLNLINRREPATSHIITQEDIRSIPARSTSSIIGIVGGVTQLSGMNTQMTNPIIH